MICPHCDGKTPNKSLFCGICGQRVAVRCPSCDKRVPVQMVHCTRCGLAVGEGIEGGQDKNVTAVLSPRHASSPPVLPTITPPPGDPTPSAADRFLPPELADKLEAARSSGAMEGERRVVTMLFCDVKGSTAAAEQMDPEEWTEIINEAFEQMIRPVYKYEGTVARLMGDGILAFFGAPIAHEDDPQRAVLAGLDILDNFRNAQPTTHNFQLLPRVGINTGLVVVGAVGSDLRMEYTAMGDAINLAARMEQTAEPGTVQIAEDTWQQVAPLFNFEELGGIEVKGKSEPVRAWRVVDRKSDPGRLRGIEGIEAPLIGRDNEWQSLALAAEQVEKGVGGIVFLVGEAGLGKSRLTRELHLATSGQRDMNGDSASSVAQATFQIPNWIETAVYSYETAQPYALFRRLLRRMIGASHTEPALDVREKLASLSEAFPVAQRVRTEQLFATLLGVADEAIEGEAFRQELFAAMTELWSFHFANEPGVIVCEDIHWADSASVELLLHLLPLVASAPLLLICTERNQRDVPGRRLREQAEAEFYHLHREIVLSPLSETDSSAMLDALLPSAELPHALRARVLERATGNPFFLEEVVRTLIESGAIFAEMTGGGKPIWRTRANAGSITIPGNLQSLLTARIDALDGETRHTLQVASVIGRSFYQRVLATIDDTSETLDSHLQALMRQDMIREAARLPEVEYVFRNPLTQEAAYRTILLRQRREFHRRVGEAMETIFSERLDELAPRLAEHFAEAQVSGKAANYFTAAGDAAFRLYANEAAVAHYSRALEMWSLESEGVSDDQLVHLFTRKGRAQELLARNGEALETYAAMLSWAEERDIPELALAGYLAQATIYSSWTDFRDADKAQQSSEKALDLAESLGAESAQTRIRWNMLWNAMIKSDYAGAIAYGKEGLALARRLHQREEMALILSDLALPYMSLGNFAEAMASVQEGEGLWRDLDNQPLLANNLNFQAQLYLIQGALDESQQAIDSLMTIGLGADNTVAQINGYNSTISVSTEIGAWGAALDAIAKGGELARPLGGFYTTLFAILHSNVLAVIGANEEAEALFATYSSQITSLPIPFPDLIRLYYMRSYLQEQRLAEAEEVAAALSEPLAELVYTQPFLAREGLPISVQFALLRGKVAEAIERSATYIEWCEKTGYNVVLPVLRYWQARSLLANGETEAAHLALTQARSEAESHNQRPILAHILGLLAELTADLGQSAALRAQTQDVLEWMGESAGNPVYRDALLAEAERQLLVVRRVMDKRDIQPDGSGVDGLTTEGNH